MIEERAFYTPATVGQKESAWDMPVELSDFLRETSYKGAYDYNWSEPDYPAYTVRVQVGAKVCYVNLDVDLLRLQYAHGGLASVQGMILSEVLAHVEGLLYVEANKEYA